MLRTWLLTVGVADLQEAGNIAPLLASAPGCQWQLFLHACHEPYCHVQQVLHCSHWWHLWRLALRCHGARVWILTWFTRIFIIGSENRPMCDVASTSCTIPRRQSLFALENEETLDTDVMPAQRRPTV